MEPYFIGVGLTLIALDFFVASEVPSFIGYFMISIALSMYLDLSPVTIGLVVVLSFASMVLLHYLLLTRLRMAFARMLAGRTSFATGDELLVGKMGVVVEVSGRRMLRVDGELCMFLDDGTRAMGAVVLIRASMSGVLEISDPNKQEDST